MADKYGYAEQTRESVRQAATQSDSKYDRWCESSTSWFKPKSGENCIRLIPWLNTRDKEFDAYRKIWGDRWGITVTVHWQVGPNKGSYLCLDKMKKQPCPICDAWRGENIEEIAPGDRILCWLIDRNDEKAGPQLWAMPLTVSKEISIISEPRGGGLVQVAHWNDGYDIFFDCEGEEKRRKYKRIALDTKASYLAQDEKIQDKWLDDVFEKRLPDMLKYFPADYLDKVLSGQREPGTADRDDRGGGRTDRRRRPESSDSTGDREEASSRSGRSRDDGDNGQAPRRGEAAPEERRPRDDNGDRSDRRRDAAAADADGDRSRPGRRGEEPERDREAESANEAREAASSSRREERAPDARDEARERLRDVGRGEGRDRRR